MISKEHEMELLRCWYSEQCDSWRDDCEGSEKWREALTGEERQLVAGWDRETPVELISLLLGEKEIEENGRLSIQAEYRGTPEEVKKAKRIMRRTIYRMRATGVLVFGTVVVRRDGELRSTSFSTARKKPDA